MIGHTVMSVWEVGIVATLLALVLGWRNLHKTGDRRWLRHVMATALNMLVLISAFSLRYLPMRDRMSAFVALLLLGLIAFSFMLLFSHTEFSIDNRRNTWWSGFLQGLPFPFALR